MDDYLTDQQRAEQVTVWLRENGLYLLGGVVLGLAGVFGWQQWQTYKASAGERASALYEELLTAVRVDRPERADELAAQLAREFGSTPYVDQAHLALAKLKLDHDAPEEAAKYLQQVADGGRNAEMRAIGKLRLARVLAQQDKNADALKVLDPVPDSAFAARFHEIRGDIFQAMNKDTEARTEYELALKGNQPGVIDRALVQAKLDDLGAAPVPAAAAVESGPTAPAGPAKP